MAGSGKPRPIKPQALWVRVDQNRLKLGVFVGLFVGGSAILLTLAFVAVPGSLIGLAIDVTEYADVALYVQGLVRVFFAALVLLLLVGGVASAVLLSNGEDWVRNRFKGSDLPSGENPVLERAVGDMTVAAGLTEPPRIIVFDTDSVNACVIGMNRARPALGVTRGLLSSLDEGEQRAVVAALVARVVSGDILVGTALAALMGPLKAIRESRGKAGSAASGCADAGCSSPGCAGDGCGSVFDGLGDSDSAGGCLAAIAIAVFVAVVIALTYAAVVSAAWIVTIWGRALSRTGYEKADAEGMLLLKDPGPMLSALKKAITSSNEVADGDASYDGIFFVSTSGKPAVERVERRRYDRLRETLGTDGLAAGLD
jgi:Zn-dependent protease with chaperone function